MEPPQRSRVGDHPRDAVETEWEVFVREETAGPLTHVGSVTAPSVDVAHEQATRLFGWYADDVWIVAAEDVARFSTHDMDDNAAPAPVGGAAGAGGTRGPDGTGREEPRSGEYAEERTDVVEEGTAGVEEAPPSRGEP